VSSNEVRSFRHPGLRSATLLVACVAIASPVLIACSATVFGSPTRHAVANLQAADTKVGTTLEIEDAIIALPGDDVAAKGGLAYLQFDAINFSNQPDGLLFVTADVDATASPTASPAASGASGPASSAASTQPAAESLQAATDTTVPAATASGPGTIRINVLLRTLTEPLQQGDTVTIGLTFHNSGSVSGLLVPVQGAAVDGTFLPTAPPPAPSSSAPASPAPVSSAPASPTPVATPASSGSAPASTPASSPASPSAAGSS
jgi:hypothetical protein